MNNKHVTIYDIAEKTGVSAVTVHRALSNKGRISEKTKTLILETAQAMGYQANPAAQGLRRTPIKIGAVLSCPVDEYVNDIIQGIADGAADLAKYNVSVDIIKIDHTNNRDALEKMLHHLQRLSEENYNGILVFSSSYLDEIEELTAMINEMSQNGIAVATVANEIPHTSRVLHVGVDAFTAGRMAAQILEIACAQKEIAILTASQTSAVNQNYTHGFMDYAGNTTFSNIHTYEHFDDPKRIQSVVTQMLEENPNLAGVYMSTASSALACHYIRQAKKDDLFIVTTDIVSETPLLLKNKTANATIYQMPYRQGKVAIRNLYNHLVNVPCNSVQLLLPQIVLESNVDFVGKDKISYT